MARQDNEAKQRGFYADITDGSLQQPCDIDEAVTHTAIISATSLVRVVELFTSDEVMQIAGGGKP